MKRIRVVLATLAMWVLPLCGADGPPAPTQTQLTELLAGNSLVGIWAGKHYAQYFDPGGNTRYREQDGPVTQGRWRVNEQGQYCSVWPPSDRWVCYEVRVSGNDIYWKSGSEFYPAEVLPGNQFDN